MPLTLPDFDDRRWEELVEEGRSLIPVYSPDWTDHNVHDPGLTLMEIFAWIAESDIYRLNRIPEQRRLKFLALAGFRPLPPRGSRTALALRLDDSVNTPLELPSGVEFEAADPRGQPTLLRTQQPLTVAPTRLKAVQSASPEGAFTDLTRSMRRGERLPLLGDDPSPGSALYLGFDEFPQSDAPISVYFEIEDGGIEERRRLIEWMLERSRHCRTPDRLIHCPPPCGGKDASDEGASTPTGPLSHHSARTVWEALTESGWATLSPQQAEDDTRALTLSGRVALRIPPGLPMMRLGEVEQELRYLRCRMVAGAYDAPPRAEVLFVNGVTALQETWAYADWPIAVGATVQGQPPPAGDPVRLTFALDVEGRLTEIDFTTQQGFPFKLLEYRAPAADAEGRLVLEAALAGIGNGKPEQEMELSQAPVAGGDPDIYSLEEEGWRRWEQKADFDASKPSDAHFTLEPDEGLLVFGDGDRGRVVPKGAVVMAVHRVTRGEEGNLETGFEVRLADTPSNRALKIDWEQTADSLQETPNPLPAIGGRSAETLDEAVSRAFRAVDDTPRAVTLSDYERLAPQTPGVKLARVWALANAHPAFPCYQADGVLTLIVVPHLPRGRPLPSLALRRAVAAYLAPRRTLGTRLEVTGPVYSEITVRARVRACPGSGREALRRRIEKALESFFDPLAGGPEGEGWPFGRDVYGCDVRQVIDDVPGVDHVLWLELAVDGKSSCGNVCLPPLGLTTSGPHQIEVAREES